MTERRYRRCLYNFYSYIINIDHTFILFFMFLFLGYELGIYTVTPSFRHSGYLSINVLFIIFSFSVRKK